jgi:outer membrane protein OmpA-like peptidoglycan-associated protein
MSPVKPMLDDLELQQVQRVDVEEDQVLKRHAIPSLEGDFLQDLGRRVTRISLTGVATGEKAAEGLKGLREKFQAAEPISFVADIATATRVDKVLIEELEVRELAGKPERFAYALTLREFQPPPATEVEQPPEPEPPPPPDDDIDRGTGTLEVEVVVEGVADFDFSRLNVGARGTQADGTQLARVPTNRTDNVWTEANFPAGQYTVEAATTEAPPLSGSATATVQPGATTRVTITLRPGAVVATTFAIHFRFDKAFIEPCLRPVLRQIAQRALANPSEKILIVGHTDKVGPDAYNQSLSERRARAVFAFLTFGVNAASRAAAVAEWNTLRLRRPPGEQPTVKDTWDVREYQHILQDLGFYPGNVDGRDGPLTQDAVRAYRCHKGLPPGTTVDDEVWNALIEDYLGQDNLTVPLDRFLRNAKDSCDGGILKWLGCGEEDPVKNVGTAWRPNRRTEVLFVNAGTLPCEVPKPDTFDLPTPGVVGTTWCLGPGNLSQHCCAVSRHLKPGTNDPQPCPNNPQGPWCRHPAEPGLITATGSIKRELPDGTLEPVPNQRFVLIAPNGEFKQGEQSNGEAVPARTTGGSGAARGTFEFPNLPKGIYSLEVLTSAPVLVRLEDQTDREVKGNAVCKALRDAAERLDVVIIIAPVKREIRLPTVVHVMTALHPATGEVRTCTPALGAPAPQASTLTDDQVRALFEGANRIWRQARIRFELDDADIVREAYSFRVECEIDDAEFQILLERCAYPDVVNVFFVGDLAGLGEAGFGVSRENAAAAGLEGGCAVGERFQSTILGPPINVPLSLQAREQVLAHELGHYLNLEHVDDTPANADRLMLPGTRTGENRRLDSPEADPARASRGAADDCVPLSLRVTGATRVGARLSNQFIVIQDPAAVVTVDAEIPAQLLDPARGALVMTGGNPGAPPLQRTVSAVTKGVTEVLATYTPVGGGPPIAKRVVIRVATFQLRVEGATQVGGAGSTTFVVRQDPTAVVTVFADIDPAPFCIPTTLVTWTGGDPAPHPLRRRVPAVAIGTATVSGTVAGSTLSVTIVGVGVTLDVDADRDGVVEEGATGKDAWEFGAGKKGAVILCNNDDDDVDGSLDNANTTIDGVNDVRELAPLIVRRSGVLPPGLQLVLSVSDLTKIRIFDQRSASGTVVIGPGLAAQFVVTTAETADVEFGMEATQYPQVGFDGTVTIRLSLREGGTETTKDEITVRIAPWLMPSHLDVTQELFVVEIPGFNTAPRTFLSELEAAATSAGVPLRKASGTLFPDPWMQDCMEVGYSRAPGHAFPVVLNAVRGRPLRTFGPSQLLGPDFGLEAPGSGSGNTFDSHGNLEVSPPVTVAGKDFKFGRIYFGRGRPATPFNSTIRSFLRSQLIQKPIELDTDWLAVGHVDEIVSLIPSNVGKRFRMLIASTDEAIRILTDLRTAGRGGLTLFTGKTSTPSPFGERTIDSILGDASLLGDNTAICQPRLNAVQATMEAELGLDPLTDIIKIPVLFVEHDFSPRRFDPTAPPFFVALIPDMVNLLVITRPDFGRTQLVIAKPFGPVLLGVDQLEKDVRDKLAPLAYAPSQIHFVDDFDSYHLGDGEVHCATNSRRQPPVTPWWEQTDF